MHVGTSSAPPSSSTPPACSHQGTGTRRCRSQVQRSPLQQPETPGRERTGGNKEGDKSEDRQLITPGPCRFTCQRVRPSPDRELLGWATTPTPPPHHAPRAKRCRCVSRETSIEGSRGQRGRVWRHAHPTDTCATLVLSPRLCLLTLPRCHQHFMNISRPPSLVCKSYIHDHALCRT